MKKITEWVTLEGKLVRLDPLSMDHYSDLLELIKKDKPNELWYTTVPSPSALQQDIDHKIQLQKKGLMLPFTIISKITGRVVGVTTFMNIDNQTPRLEIGSTWYAKEVQRTGTNTEAKYLLLRYALEDLQCIAVEFRTHRLNQISRKAIERLGAKLDGILRNHRLTTNGQKRDTCVYSITDYDWPSVKTHLEWLMKKYS
ncbi:MULTISPECIES: GNAT family N-acetyltransferase [Proteus]|jgi:RimJ/RimL family protein N-acetyltransferase|uniref:Acetyltransferase n=1 Tax=Proteus vulgaris TaxID=585 RepID=A0A379F499_PROVU|nr:MULTISPECIES: GNAT family protein [Proteus]NBN61116.1 GNAT family N-acetyltransferase [Proteus sp. G2639]RNT29364.1 N-acetyltransferase [Proteus mirabilis]KGA60643.1 acetyltransferase family protein [Proteus vulgaris]MBG5971254.1 GNAT family N-acetyltransferase [Proteus vulgaris]MBG5983993.1 GNAT family N-acetyltransferase [Proteus vulgaris]